MIAPLAVSQDGTDAAFVVMIAGPAVSGADIVTEQAARLAQAAGADARTGRPDPRRPRARSWPPSSPTRMIRTRPPRPCRPFWSRPDNQPLRPRRPSRQVSAPWYRWFASHDPAPALAALTVPMLAVYGGKDLQVPADQNADALRRIQPNAEVVVLPGLNHLMQTAGTGLPGEYGTIEETVSPAAIRVVETGSCRRPLGSPRKLRTLNGWASLCRSKTLADRNALFAESEFDAGLKIIPSARTIIVG